MRLIHARLLKMFERPDGKARLGIFERDDGLFEFRGEAEQDEDGDVYWAEMNISGLYDTSEHAERDAISSVPWLRTMMGSK